MLKTAILPALTSAVFLVAGCGQSEVISPSDSSPAVANIPASGNGNKEVFTISNNTVISCPNGETLHRNFDGWVQVRTFTGSGNPNVELDVWHLIRTYTNSEGETYVFNDVGPDRYYLDEDGNLILEVSGRSGGGFIGHLVLNLTTGEVELRVGREFGSPGDLACDALT